ncbi:GlsB/YeaQ/YmgE family stress response membrane protein [soil metagenome]
MNILLWILFGALVGWIASIIMRTNAEQGALGNIVVGIIGAFIGGMIANTMLGAGFEAFTLAGFVFSVLGAVILLFLMRLVTGGRTTTR